MSSALILVAPRGKRITVVMVSPIPLAQAWKALYALCVGFFMILIDQTIVSVATPALQEDLGANYNQIIWVHSAYLLTFAVPLLITGRLGDRWGQRNVYIIGMVIFTLSSLACGLAPSMAALIWCRALQGIGASLLTPQTMAVINRIFSPQKRGAALGIWGMVAGLAGLCGPLAGGLITANFGWQWIFFINVPIGVASVIAVARYVPLLDRTEKPIDVLSMVLSVIAVLGIVYALLEGEPNEWAWWIWVLLAVGLVFAALFVWRQHSAAAHGKDVLMPLNLFHYRNFSLGLVGIMTMGFAVAGTPLPIMLFLQQVYGLTPVQAALVTVPQALGGIVLSPFVGRWADRISPNILAFGGFSAAGLAFICLCVAMMQHAPIWTMVLILLVYGLSNSFIWAPNSTATMRDLAPQLMGVASGTYNTIRQVGSVLGSAIIGAVLQWRLAVTEDAHAYGQAVLVAAIALLCGACAAGYAYKGRASSVR